MKLRTNSTPLGVTSKARIIKFHKIGELHTCDIEATVQMFRKIFVVGLRRNRKFG